MVGFEVMGRRNEAIAERKLTRSWIHCPPSSAFELALAFYCDYDKAIEQFLKTLELDQNFPPAHHFLSAAYEQKGSYGEAIARFKSAIPLKPNSEWSLSIAWARPRLCGVR